MLCKYAMNIKLTICKLFLPDGYQIIEGHVKKLPEGYHVHKNPPKGKRKPVLHLDTRHETPATVLGEVVREERASLNGVVYAPETRANGMKDN